MFLAAALVWLGGVAPLTSLYQDRADELSQRAAVAARLEQRAAALPELRARTAGLPPQAVIQPLAGGSDAEAAAGLQEQLQAMASAANLTISSVETLPAANDGTYRRIEVQLAVTSGYPSLIGLLKAIAASPTPLVVTGLDLAGPPRGRPSDSPSIDSVITVAGWRATS
jgi:Tfp pilus assembly protein PilO